MKLGECGVDLSLRSQTYYGPSGHGFARELEHNQLAPRSTQRVGRENEWRCSVRASLAFAMYVPPGFYRPTAVSEGLNMKGEKCGDTSSGTAVYS